MNCFCGIADMRGASLDFARLLRMRGGILQRGAARTEAYIERSVGLLCACELDSGSLNTSLPHLHPIPGGTLALALDGEVIIPREPLEEKPQSAAAPNELAERFLTFGCETPLEIDGEFSFAAIDSVRRELFLAVDTECSHPIFFHKDKNRLVFSNSIRPLLSYSPQAAEVDKAAIIELLCAPAGEVSSEDIYKNISPLNSGHFMVFSGLGASVCEYASRKSTLSTKESTPDGKKVISLTKDRTANIVSAAEEILFCFDYPEFDEYSPEYLSAVRHLKEHLHTTCRISVEELSADVSESFAKLKADRIGAAFGIRLSPILQKKKTPHARAFLSEREKKLSLCVKAILSSPQSHIKRIFGSSLDAILSRECDTASKVRTLGKIIGLERWLESYPIIPT